MGNEEKRFDPQIQRIDQITERIGRYVGSRFAGQEDSFQPKITPVKFILLRTVYLNRRCMVADLSREVNLTSGATTLALNRLEKEGLIRRQRDQADRRIVWVELSEEGEALVEKILWQRQQMFKQMLSVLTEDEQDLFIKLLEKISFKLCGQK
ncbi:MarR family winged helix-turn-helix transcriptional regulator [Thermoactinomyces sp. CICC 10522]|jgi:DNA-binding MarR family transcriptional regulator|uniref:MarR family winged helix-turn-helix transcriptional regulator n=1 Tax=Thermoactinomyces sp. CICC 10522 TaxID=2767427 RepID=UPI0018DE6A99|nr:MarR family transcriptional regulator [Thermoactinomyces sp. CICC 10522]MBH8603777.1 MarR family transcriptional regulator [Thermoactinomyces sp. CICC 10522]